ncbi:hypothetical protein FIBSPDRAFT_947406 [Athelia psychrophila]|uniref:Uncharacterized protein n=1 Tax=Athelia psychrophila TaxID=1759441 RepID=A0A166RRI5_9AGAM|nr:hypothetical protein FIBSPDRAFT_947406 [Fibularhizoctonia sp. CBS 109695]
MSTSAVVNVNDPRVQYSGDWSNGESNLHTTEYGAEVRFTFIGTSVAVYGMIMDETTGTAPPMSNFTIDDMPPVTFIEPAEGTPFDDVRFYLSPVLPNGEHTLIVTNANTGMLWIDYFTLSTLIDSITTSETTMAPPSTTSTMGSTSAAPPSETVPGAIILSTSTTLPITPSTSVFVVSSSPVPVSFIASASSSQESSSTSSLSTSASGTPSTSTLSSSITSLASGS